MSRLRFEAPQRTGGLRHWLRAQAHGVSVRLRPPQAYFVDAPHGESLSLLEAFAHWCARHPGASARVLLSGALTHQYVLPLEGAQTLYGQARTRFARRHFVHYYGEQAQNWPLETWAQAQRHGACAVHGIELSALRDVAKRHQVRLHAVEPIWAWTLRWVSLHHPAWAQAPSVALVFVERTLLTWLLCSQGSIVQIQQRRLQCATLQELAGCLDALKSPHDPAMPVWVGGFGLDCNTPMAAPVFEEFTALDGAHMPQVLLT